MIRKGMLTAFLFGLIFSLGDCAVSVPINISSPKSSTTNPSGT